MSSAPVARNASILTLDTADTKLVSRIKRVWNRSKSINMFGRQWLIVDILSYGSDIGERHQIDLTWTGKDT